VQVDDYWNQFEAWFPEHFDGMTGENAIAFLTSDATITHFTNFFEDSGIEIIEDYKDVFTQEEV